MSDENCQEEMEMPRYVCHKKVWALKIKSVTKNPNGSIDLFFEDKAFASINIENASKLPEPSAGWYYVVYEDGYKSFSPEKAFEDGYTALNIGCEEEDELTA